MAKQGGFILSETLITATVTTIGMLMIGQMLVAGAHGTRVMRERSAVTNVAQRVLETVRSQGFDTLSRQAAATADGQHLRTTTTVAVNFLTGKTLGDGGTSIPALLPAGYRLYGLTQDILLRENDPTTPWDNQVQVTIEMQSMQSPGKAVSVASLVTRSLSQ